MYIVVSARSPLQPIAASDIARASPSSTTVRRASAPIGQLRSANSKTIPPSPCTSAVIASFDNVRIGDAAPASNVDLPAVSIGTVSRRASTQPLISSPLASSVTFPSPSSSAPTRPDRPLRRQGSRSISSGSPFNGVFETAPACENSRQSNQDSGDEPLPSLPRRSSVIDFPGLAREVYISAPPISFSTHPFFSLSPPLSRAPLPSSPFPSPQASPSSSPTVSRASSPASPPRSLTPVSSLSGHGVLASETFDTYMPITSEAYPDAIRPSRFDDPIMITGVSSDGMFTCDTATPC